MSSIPILISRRKFLWASGGVLATLATEHLNALSIKSNKKINVALVGLGRRGHDHLSAIMTSGLAEIVGVCDKNELLATRVAGIVERKSGVRPRAVMDYRYLIESRKVDALAISVGDDAHASAARHVYEAGKHLLVDPPVASTAHGTGECPATQSSSQMIQLNLPCRADNVLGAAITRMRAGRIGIPFEASVWISQPESAGDIGSWKSEVMEGIDCCSRVLAGFGSQWTSLRLTTLNGFKCPAYNVHFNCGRTVVAELRVHSARSVGHDVSKRSFFSIRGSNGSFQLPLLSHGSKNHEVSVRRLWHSLVSAIQHDDRRLLLAPPEDAQLTSVLLSAIVEGRKGGEGSVEVFFDD